MKIPQGKYVFFTGKKRASKLFDGEEVEPRGSRCA
jgi:hypothetical protein